MTDTNTPKPKKQRSGAQNRSMHKLFGNIADEMTAQGIGMRPLLANVELQVSAKNIKEVWRAVQLHELGKESTAELTTDECEIVWQHMIPILRKTGLEAEWPSWQEMQKKEYYQFMQSQNGNH